MSAQAAVRRGVLAGSVAVLVGASMMAVPATAAVAVPLRCQTPSTTFDQSIPAAQALLGYAQVSPLTTGQGVTVAIIDTGVDASAPQLAGRVTTGLDLTGSGVPEASDCLGRGTALASIVAASPTADAAFVGVAPEARIDPIRVAAGGDQEPSADLIATGIVSAANAGDRVALVASANLPAVPSLIYALAYATSHGLLVVSPVPAPSAQSGGAPPGALKSDGLVTVSVLMGQPQTATQAPAVAPDLLAPGNNVLALAVGGRGTVVGSGNTYAAAFVAGAAALVRSYYPTLSVSQVIERLELTAAGSGKRPDSVFGWGLVSPYNAVAADLPVASSEQSTAPSAFSVPTQVESKHPERRRALVVLAGLAGVAALLLARAITARSRRRRVGTRSAATKALGGG